MIDRYGGDPKLYVSGSGASIKWLGGQPIMDSGLENTITCTLLVKKGWPGNAFIRDPADHFGSDFVEATEEPITISMLNNVASIAERDLDETIVQDQLADDVTVDAINPDKLVIDTVINITPPGETKIELQLTKYAKNWEMQYAQPAGARE